MQSPQTEIVLGNGLGLAVTIGFELADEACVGEQVDELKLMLTIYC